jgi:Family of unknown function (DUF6356)
MFERWFLAHPRSVNESYLEHQATALSFSGSLFKAAAVCFVHALIPGLFERTASKTVENLHQRMATHRQRQGGTSPHEPAPMTHLSRSDA